MNSKQTLSLPRPGVYLLLDKQSCSQHESPGPAGLPKGQMEAQEEKL